MKITDIDNWGLRGEMTSKKLIVVLGPTACGKTSIATKLALKYKGEIVSADSRQVYLGMDIGTGKDLGDYKIGNVNIPYHLTDVVDPRVEFNVAEYQKQAYEAIDDILSRGKNPFLVGGTGLYIDAVTRGYKFVAKNSKLETKKIRKKLDKLSLNQLLIKLKKIDLSTYKTIDKKNRRRVQRAVEIFYETGITKSASLKSTLPDYDILFIGIKFPLEKIYSKIDKRLSDRIDEGMVREVKKLRKSGVSWKRLDDFGLEYRWVSRYLRGIVDYKESVEQLRLSIHRFAKRQLTWFKRNEDIMWVDKLSEADSLINKFLED